MRFFNQYGFEIEPDERILALMRATGGMTVTPEERAEQFANSETPLPFDPANIAGSVRSAIVAAYAAGFRAAVAEERAACSALARKLGKQKVTYDGREIDAIAGMASAIAKAIDDREGQP